MTKAADREHQVDPRRYDALCTAVSEYAPVILNEVIAHFGRFVDDTRPVRELGRLALELVLARGPGEVPTTLSEELLTSIATAAGAITSRDPAEVGNIVRTAFTIAGEMVSLRAEAERIHPDVIAHFVAVVVAVDGLVMKQVTDVVSRDAG